MAKGKDQCKSHFAKGEEEEGREKPNVNPISSTTKEGASVKFPELTIHIYIYIPKSSLSLSTTQH